jgi:adenylate cyclase
VIGAHHAGREVAGLADDASGARRTYKRDAPQARVIKSIVLVYFPLGYAAAIVLVFVARGVRSLRERRSGLVAISFPDRQVRVPKGVSVLEACLRYSIPHASVCGGRARCSTCRIRVLGDVGALPPPSGRKRLCSIASASPPTVDPSLASCGRAPHRRDPILPSSNADLLRRAA